jgi:hypothetical protein
MSKILNINDQISEDKLNIEDQSDNKTSIPIHYCAYQHCLNNQNLKGFDCPTYSKEGQCTCEVHRIPGPEQQNEQNVVMFCCVGCEDGYYFEYFQTKPSGKGLKPIPRHYCDYKDCLLENQRSLGKGYECPTFRNLGKCTCPQTNDPRQAWCTKHPNEECINQVRAIEFWFCCDECAREWWEVTEG